MKKSYKQYIFLGIAILLYLVLALSQKEEINWNAHYKSDSKDPYGTKALDEIIKGSPLNITIQNVRLTPYEIYDSLSQEYSDKNLIVIGDEFSTDETSLKILLDEAKKGRSIFIAAEYFDYEFEDTLKFITTYEKTLKLKDIAIDNNANVTIDTLCISSNGKDGYFSDFEIMNTFESYDTLNTEVLATHDHGFPVFIKTKVGKGAIYLLSTPKILTNIALLKDENHQLVSEIISALPEGNYIRTEYHTRGRVGQSSPLRVVLTKDGIKEATYLILALIFIYLIFQSKREQRAIPEIFPPTNDSMEYIKTLGQLYLDHNDNPNILSKRKRFLIHHIKNKYHVNLLDGDIDNNIKILAFRTGIEESELRRLISKIDKEINSPISNVGFVEANKLLDEFYKKEI